MTKLIRLLVWGSVVFLYLGLHLIHVDAHEDDQEFARLISRVKTGVVAIGVFDIKQTPMTRFIGTGFVIKPGNRIVTNHHVIEPIKRNQLFNLRIFHRNFSKRGVKAGLLAEDKFHDLAILEMKEKKAPVLDLAKQQVVREGYRIAFTGYPLGFILGLNATTHTGIISAISPIILPSPSSRNINTRLIKYLEKPFEILQIDATAYPGNSGSPVYRTATGEVVGVINKVFIKGKKEHLLKDPSGITYAIPIEYVHRLIEQIK